MLTEEIEEGDLVKWVSYENKNYKGKALKNRGKKFLVQVTHIEKQKTFRCVEVATEKLKKTIICQKNQFLS